MSDIYSGLPDDFREHLREQALARLGRAFSNADEAMWNKIITVQVLRNLGMSYSEIRSSLDYIGASEGVLAQCEDAASLASEAGVLPLPGEITLDTPTPSVPPDSFYDGTGRDDRYAKIEAKEDIEEASREFGLKGASKALDIEKNPRSLQVALVSGIRARQAMFDALDQMEFTDDERHHLLAAYAGMPHHEYEGGERHYRRQQREREIYDLHAAKTWMHKTGRLVETAQELDVMLNALGEVPEGLREILLTGIQDTEAVLLPIKARIDGSLDNALGRLAGGHG